MTDATGAKFAILGWGSLVWDKDLKHEWYWEQIEGKSWLPEGPSLRLEFSRISESRENALTLVIENGSLGAACTISYAVSRRTDLDDVACDLRCREGTTIANIGFCWADPRRPARSRNGRVLDIIRPWLKARGLTGAVWTDLTSNFAKKSTAMADFSVNAAIAHVQALSAEGKAKAAEYMWRAPDFVQTPVRAALQREPWFAALKPTDVL